MVTSHKSLLKLELKVNKIKNSVPELHQPYFKHSIAMHSLSQFQTQPLHLQSGKVGLNDCKITLALVFCDFFLPRTFLGFGNTTLDSVSRGSLPQSLSLHLAKCTSHIFTLYVRTKCLTKNMVMYSTKALCTKYSLRVKELFFFLL